MNEALRLTALFVRDLLQYDEQLIRIGRQNYEIADFTVGYIGVDTLGPARRLASGKSYDDVAEIMTHSQQWSAPIVLSFYGNDAWDTATDFSLLVNSQTALELQETLGIGVHQVSNLSDVKILVGQEYGERVEVNFNVHYTVSVDRSILRIDTEQLDINSENGQEFIK